MRKAKHFGKKREAFTFGDPIGRHERLVAVMNGRRPLPSSPVECLPEVPIDPRNRRRVLRQLLADYGLRHGTRDKVVSFETREQRKIFYSKFFDDLAAGPGCYRLDPRSLGSRHIQHMVRKWVETGLSASTIQTYLSHLRVLSTWIGKPGLVLPPERYGIPRERIRRTLVAQEDKSWTTKGVDTDEVIERLMQIDQRVAAQTLICATFGTRVKEALMLRPHRAVVDGTHPGIDTTPERKYLQVVRGTKGGRLRFVEIDSPAKQAALDAGKAVAGEDESLADPTLSLKQAQRRYYYVAESVGISRARLGVITHGLRHQYANDKFERLAGVPSPVRGGPSTRVNDDAKRAIVEDLGHARLQIASAYLGGARKVKPT